MPPETTTSPGPAPSSPAGDKIGAGAALETGSATPANVGPGEALKSDATVVEVPGGPVPGLGAAAAALGAPVVPMPVGGPGVGAARVATEVSAVRTVPLDGAGHEAEVDRFLTGRVSAGVVSPDQRRHYERLASTPEGFETVRALFPVGQARRETFDPDDVPGTHVLRALTNIRHDNRSYAAGEEIELDFRAYEQLVSIAAVPPIDWRTGRPLRI